MAYFHGIVQVFMAISSILSMFFPRFQEKDPWAWQHHKLRRSRERKRGQFGAWRLGVISWGCHGHEKFEVIGIIDMIGYMCVYTCVIYIGVYIGLYRYIYIGQVCIYI